MIKKTYTIGYSNIISIEAENADEAIEEAELILDFTTIDFIQDEDGNIIWENRG